MNKITAQDVYDLMASRLKYRHGYPKQVVMIVSEGSWGGDWVREQFLERQEPDWETREFVIEGVL